MPLIVPGVTPPHPNASDEFVPALIVVDMQADFVSGSLAVPDAQSIIDPINTFLTLPFARKIGTKDYHPPNHISFASNHAQKDVGHAITIYPPGADPDSQSQVDHDRGIEQILWPDHCVQSTPGAEFVEGLDHAALDAVVHKGTHPGIESYSAFRDPWHISHTELHGLLKGVTDVFVVGLAADYCVKFTAMDAVQFRYRTWVVTDLVKSVAGGEAHWDELRESGVLLVESKEVRERLESRVV
ncbi:pyrazinamidase/nicotinamidase [Athelia psychrophila]|uniref:nicotinamidase n=1 Tax=Athelia psychrophila TaxID=1759441 RepID=A0A166I9U3_9AGAM|nr:pyrazinamidase/nicotinamidase [Fibularhizoctonia sp. CBS 109695]